MRPIPFLSPQLPPQDAIGRYFDRSREAGWYANSGPCVSLFAERATVLLGGVDCIPVANCTLGLMLALKALAGEPDGARREVVLPSFTFAATAAAARWAGFDLVFVDVEPKSWHLDPDALAAALEERDGRVAAVLACSTFGAPPARALTEAWERLAGESGVPLVVDSAAGFGAVDETGARLGRQGNAEVFSLHATKTFPIGEGGIVATLDGDLAACIRRLSNFGFGADRVVRGEVGLNAKMDELHAATALAVLDGIEEVLASRRAYAAALRERLEPLGYSFQEAASGSAWQFVPVLAPDGVTRAAALREAREGQVEVRTYFDPPLHKMPAFAGVARGPLEVTESLAGRVLSLPIANNLSAEDVERVMLVIERALHVESRT